MPECGLVIRFEPGTAHGDETVSRRAIFLNIVEIGRVIGCCGVLTVYAPGHQLCAGIQDHILQRMNKEDMPQAARNDIKRNPCLCKQGSHCVAQSVRCNRLVWHDLFCDLLEALFLCHKGSITKGKM